MCVFFRVFSLFVRLAVNDIGDDGAKFIAEALNSSCLEMLAVDGKLGNKCKFSCN